MAEIGRTQYEVRVYAPSTGAAPFWRLSAVMGPAAFKWSLRYRRVVNGLGSWTATLDANDPRCALFARNALVEIRRQPDGYAWATEFVGIVKYDGIDEESQALKATFGGPDLNWLLTTEDVRRDAGAGDGMTRADGVADRVMKDLVRDTIGPGAPAGARFPELGIAAYLPADDGGNAESVTLRYEDLWTVLTDITRRGALDFWLAFTPPVADPPAAGAVTFTTGVLGTDRTEATGTATGGPIFVFSDRRGNMADVHYLDDWRETLSVPYVLGAGEGAEQEVYEYPQAYGSGRWDRVAHAVDARDAAFGDAVALLAAGTAAAAEKPPLRTLTFSARETPTSRYGVHYFLGDRVTCELSYRAFVEDYRVRAVQVWLSGDEAESVVPELEQI